MKHDVIATRFIQFIIGDCKGNDLLCGQKGGHSLQMNGLCRDCDIHPLDGDNICTGYNLIRSFRQIANIIGKTTD